MSPGTSSATGHDAPLPLAQHARGGRGHIFERFERVGGLLFLHDADRRVERNDDEDDDALGEALPVHKVHDQGKGRRGDEDEHHHVCELLPDHPPDGLSLFLAQVVRTVGSEALGGLGIAQPLLRGRQGLFRLFDGKRMPGLFWLTLQHRFGKFLLTEKL